MWLDQSPEHLRNADLGLWSLARQVDQADRGSKHGFNWDYDQPKKRKSRTNMLREERSVRPMRVKTWTVPRARSLCADVSQAWGRQGVSQPHVVKRTFVSQVAARQHAKTPPVTGLQDACSGLTANMTEETKTADSSLTKPKGP